MIGTKLGVETHTGRTVALLVLELALGVVWVESSAAASENWPGWRGPGGVGTSRARHAPTVKNVVWSFKDPGLGHSSPVIWEDALFLTTRAGRSRLLVRLSAETGREIWRREVLSSPLEAKHLKNSYASSTPATDGERVYVSFLSDKKIVVVAAYDFAGKEIWRKSPGEFYSRHGFCSTPVLYQDLVLLNCDQDADAYLVAFDRKTGAERWRADRENKVRSYCPPTVFDVDGKPQMILSGSKTVCSYDPLTGRRLWKCHGPTEQCVASLVYGKGLIFVTGGFPDREFLAIDPRGRGDVTQTHVRWRARRGVSYVPSPLYRDGHFYVVSDSGILTALEAETGRYVNQKRLDGDFSSSLFYAAGHIYVGNEAGEMFVLRATPELETVTVWDMEAPIYASPALSQGRLFLRTWTHLSAIEARDSDP